MSSRTPLESIQHGRATLNPARTYQQQQFRIRQDQARAAGYRRISRWRAALRRHASTLRSADLGGAVLEGLVYTVVVLAIVGAVITLGTLLGSSR